MSIQKSVYSVLDDDAGVSALVKGIFPMVIPQQGGASTRIPCITYRKTTTNRQQRYCGTDGTVGDQFTIDAYGKRYADAQKMADAVKAALIDYRGAKGDRFIANIHLDNEFDLMDIEPGLYRVSMTFEVWHRAT